MDNQQNKTPTCRPTPGLRRMDQVREGLRSDHNASHTTQTPGQWTRRDRHFFGSQTHPNRLGVKEVARMLSHLVTDGQVSASTRRQGLNALVWLSHDALHMPFESAITSVGSARPHRPPIGFTRVEVQRSSGCPLP